MKTKAAILEKTGQPLRLADVELPSLKKGQILVKLDSSGICRSQLMEVTGGRGEDKYLPHLLGHEGAGIVLETGEGVTKVHTGDRVILTWIKGHGIEAGGSLYKEGTRSINSGAIATFTEYAVISENRCVKLNIPLPPDVASLFGCAVPTGAGIVLREINTSPSSTLGVWGLGGIGMSALMGAVAANCATIVAVDVSPDKLNMAKELGAHRVINATESDPEKIIAEMTGGKGLDFAIEAAGRTATIEQAFRCVRDLGGLCVFASHPPQGQTISLEPHALIRGKQIRGTWGGNCHPDEDIPLLADMYQRGKLPVERLISHCFALDQINEALDLLATGNCGRIVIEFQPNHTNKR